MAKNNKSTCPVCNQKFKPETMLDLPWPKKQPWYKLQRHREACPYCKTMLHEVRMPSDNLWDAALAFGLIHGLVGSSYLAWLFSIEQDSARYLVVSILMLLGVVKFYLSWQEEKASGGVVKYRRY